MIVIFYSFIWNIKVIIILPISIQFKKKKKKYDIICLYRCHYKLLQYKSTSLYYSFIRLKFTELYPYKAITLKLERRSK